MKVNSDKLVKISTYAREKGVSAACVYLWIQNKDINSVVIDGVIFVIMDEAAKKKGKGVRSEKNDSEEPANAGGVEY